MVTLLLTPAADADPAVRYAPNQIVVSFKDSATTEDRADLRRRLGVRDADHFGLDRIVTFEISPDLSVPNAIKIVRESGLAEWAEPNYLSAAAAVTPDDPRYGMQWSLSNTGQTIGSVTGTPGADIGAARAWKVTRGSPDTIIGVVDSGMNFNHQDFQGRIYFNPGETGGGRESNGIDDDGNGKVDDWRGWDFVNATKDPTADHEHGPHMSGVIGAAGDNGLAIAGVMWDSRILTAKALDEEASGWTTDLASAARYAAEQGAGVVNLSFGAYGGTGAIYKSVFDAHPNVLFVASAGNDYDSEPTYPCATASDNVLCVGATTSSDTLAAYSNWGPHVDIGAPGSNIETLAWNLAIGTEYTSGTSPAAALVSGAAGLLRTAYPEWTAVAIKQRIMDTVDALDSLEGRVATGGRLNIGRAIDTTPPTVIFDTSFPYATNASTPKAQVRLDWHSDEDDAPVTYECRLQGTGTWHECAPGEYLTFPFPEGDSRVEIRATDDASNTGAPVLSGVIRIDFEGPVTTLLGAPKSLSNSRTASFTFTANESATFKCSLDFAPPVPCHSPHVVTGLTDGEHRMEIVATDLAGNREADGITHSWTVDATPPAIQIPGIAARRPLHVRLAKKPPRRGFKRRAVFVPRGATSYRLKLTGRRAIKTSKRRITFKNLRPGRYVLRLVGFDAKGRRSKPLVYRFIIRSRG